MNIYYQIYCYFYNNGGEDGPGRLKGSGFVCVALFFHALLLIQIVYMVTGYKLHLLPSRGVDESLFHMQQRSFKYFIPPIALIWFYFNKKRTVLLIKKYDKKYEDVDLTNRMMWLFIGPAVLVLLLVYINQK